MITTTTSRAWRAAAGLSRLLNRATGGHPSRTLCSRIALRWGWNCVFCRVVERALRDPSHCLDELEAREIIDLAIRHGAQRLK
jgi:hypothetical protein